MGITWNYSVWISGIGHSCPRVSQTTPGSARVETLRSELARLERGGFMGSNVEGLGFRVWVIGFRVFLGSNVCGFPSLGQNVVKNRLVDARACGVGWRCLGEESESTG